MGLKSPWEFFCGGWGAVNKTRIGLLGSDRIVDRIGLRIGSGRITDRTSVFAFGAEELF